MPLERPLIELTFYETYYFANVIKNVLEDRFAFLRNLHEFYGDDRYLGFTSPFRKFSAFHEFIAFVIDEVLSEDVRATGLNVRQDRYEQQKKFKSLMDSDPTKLPVNLAMERFQIKHPTFVEWLKEHGKTFGDANDDDVSDYYADLRLEGECDELLQRASREVFFVLFQNRHVLLLFNEMIAAEMQQCAEDDHIDSDHRDVFARPGVLKRVGIPKWEQRAVYFRDRGLCVLCHRDLTGMVNIWSEDNFDHIVPLAAGGLNDVSNLQFLCRECNTKKRAGVAKTSNRYEAWYPDDE